MPHHNFPPGIRRATYIETAGVLLPDGIFIELVSDPQGNYLKLLIARGKKTTTVPKFVYRGCIYFPAVLDPSLVRSVTLPDRLRDFGTTPALFTAAERTLVDNGISAELARSLVYFVFATWFADLLPIAPCLILTGPERDAGFLLQVLSCLVYHALPLATFNAAGLLSVLKIIRPTLLVNSGNINPSGLRLLSASDIGRFCFPWQGAVVNLNVAKVIYSRNESDAEWFGDSVFRINLTSQCGNRPFLDAKVAQQIAREFQPMFLAFRLRNAARVGEWTFDVPQLPPHLRIVARVLASPLIDAGDLQAGIVPVLERQQEALVAERWLDRRCVVIAGLLYFCHVNDKTVLHVGEIARTASTIFKGRGETASLEPKAVGYILRRALGFSLIRDSRGWVLKLTPDVQRRVHTFAHDFGVVTSRDALKNCAYCHELCAPENHQGGPDGP